MVLDAKYGKKNDIQSNNNNDSSSDEDSEDDEVDRVGGRGGHALEGKQFFILARIPKI